MNLPEYDIPPSRTPAIESASPTLRSVDLYLLCFIPSPLFHAHWSIFVPSQAEPQRGTVINVRGDPLHGFVHEFQRGYIPTEDPDKPPFVTKLSSVTESVARPDGPSQPGTDATAYTELERLALSIAAPGPSLGRGASKDVSLLWLPESWTPYALLGC